MIILEITPMQKDLIKEMVLILEERRKEENGHKSQIITPLYLSRRIERSYTGVLKALSNLKERI